MSTTMRNMSGLNTRRLDAARGCRPLPVVRANRTARTPARRLPHVRVEAFLTAAPPPARAANSLSELASTKLDTIKVPIEKYMFLRDLLNRDPNTYFELVVDHTMQVMPFIYTPTVGEACQRYHELGCVPRGPVFTLNDKGKILEKLQAWPQKNVRVIVVTDGERILGLGDLGANGMGIPEGKIQIYTAAAGVDPAVCLPMTIDVGTNNAKLRDDPRYQGLRQPRPSGPEGLAAYEELIDEFIAALKVWQPFLLLQFEDFGNNNAFRLLERHRRSLCCFNDDIQGTAATTLAALLAACRAPHVPSSLKDHTILFLGAGEAGTGIGELIAHYLVTRCGLTEEQAHKKCFFMDSKGLVCKSRNDLQHHKLHFAHDVPFQSDLLDVIETVKPTALVGVSAKGGAFGESVLKAMAHLDEHPLILPLSNPTSLAECTFEDALKYTDNKCLFASGSPFQPVDGHVPSQANNAFIFPGVGMAAVLTNAREITDDIFVIAAEALADLSPQDDINNGTLLPSVSHLRDAGAHVAAFVGKFIVDTGLGSMPIGLKTNADGSGPTVEQWEEFVRSKMWEPPAKA